MGSVRSPLVGLELTPEASQYVGILEGHLAAYAIQEAKFRALLELLTGDSWETTRLDMDWKKLRDIAVSALTKKAGLSKIEARTLVTRRWGDLTSTTAPTPRSTTIEELKARTAPAPSTAQTDQGSMPPRATMAERLADWKERQKADAAKELKVQESQ